MFFYFIITSVLVSLKLKLSKFFLKPLAFLLYFIHFQLIKVFHIFLTFFKLSTLLLYLFSDFIRLNLLLIALLLNFFLSL